ncbi:MAG: FkbM family methyltransferase [Opitutales bacterium]|nr:FkbM family methyltransferase [Opitutales bacterium]
MNRLKKAIKNFLRKKGYELVRVPTVFQKYNKLADLRFTVAETLIEAKIRLETDSVIVQIGAFDGISNDFLWEFLKDNPVKAILVEPQPEYFEKLKENYKNAQGIIFENAAIAAQTGTVDFYRIKEEYHKSLRLAPQHASLHRQHLLNALSIKHLRDLPENREEAIERIQVPSLTFEDLLQKHDCDKIDILQIDTEGFDYNIIKMIDFERWSPEIVNFEIDTFTSDQIDEITHLLFEAGYQMMPFGINMIARKRVESVIEKNSYQS